MLILHIINFIGAALLGYLIGRFSDYYINFWIKDPNWIPDHWIYGAILMIASPFIFRNNLGLWLSFFGAGLFISDLKDFLKLKFYGSDNKDKSKRRFWHID
jgi:hypothetical protein